VSCLLLFFGNLNVPAFWRTSLHGIRFFLPPPMLLMRVTMCVDYSILRENMLTLSNSCIRQSFFSISVRSALIEYLLMYVFPYLPASAVIAAPLTRNGRASRTASSSACAAPDSTVPWA